MGLNHLSTGAGFQPSTVRELTLKATSLFAPIFLALHSSLTFQAGFLFPDLQEEIPSLKLTAKALKIGHPQEEIRCHLIFNH